MILDLRAFEEFPAEATIRVGSGEIEPFDDCIIRIESAECELAIQQSAQEYFCQGRLNARLVLQCARCLAEYEARIDTGIDFTVCAEEDAARYRDGDSEEYVCFKGNELQVSIVDPVRQALALALPMKPLCSEDCRGLCSQCGADLNLEQCDCNTKTTDPRWDGLADLTEG